MNIGKVFEQEFKNSIPKEYFYYRFKDSASSWNGGEKARFTPSNICDALVFGKGILTLIELKNTMGTSLPLTNIKHIQLIGLSEIATEGIRACFLICFRSKERCFLIDAKSIKGFIDRGERKSIPLKWCEGVGQEVQMIKKRTRYNLILNEIFN